MSVTQRISPCLWFDGEAEEAARYYTGIFKNSKITLTTRYNEVGFEQHHRPPGSVMAVDFELDGQKFMALNGGPEFKFNEAISLQVLCENQQEIDYYWEKLSAGGKEGQCGWLKDKFGLSWQVVPASMGQLVSNPATAPRVMAEVMKMVKLDLPTLERAAAGK